MIARGPVIGIGRAYPDGVEQRLIWLRKEAAADLALDEALRDGEESRLVITLSVGRERYSARLKTRTRDTHAYIGPDLHDYLGKRRRLVDVLRDYDINEPVDLVLEGKDVIVRKAGP